MSTVRLTEAARTVTSNINCNSEAENISDCYKLPNSYSLSVRDRNQVAGLICSTFNAYFHTDL